MFLFWYEYFKNVFSHYIMCNLMPSDRFVNSVPFSIPKIFHKTEQIKGERVLYMPMYLNMDT